MKRRYLIAVVLLTATAWVPAHAQRPDTAGGRRARTVRVQEGIERLVRRRLELSDEQLRRLREVNARFGPRREQLWRGERSTRASIRRALVEADTAPSGPLARLIDELLLTQRRRLDLVTEEQRELARFLSPVQRARYLALQEQLRDRVEGVRGRHRRPDRERGRAPGAPR